MSTELFLLLGSIAGGTGALLSFWAGWWARGQQGLPRGSYGAPRRRGSNPPSPGTKPQPTSGAPQPLAAQLIRYWTWKDDQIRQAFNEGRTIRGNRSGGPSTPKPEIVPNPQPPPRRRGSNPPPPGTKPQPPGGRLIGPDGVPSVYRPMPSRPGANPPPRNP